MRVGFVCGKVTSAAVLAGCQARDLGVEAVDAIRLVLRSAGRPDECDVGLASLPERALPISERAHVGAGFSQFVDRHRSRRYERVQIPLSIRAGSAEDLFHSLLLGAQVGCRPRSDRHGRHLVDSEVFCASTAESSVEGLGGFSKARCAGMWAASSMSSVEDFGM